MNLKLIRKHSNSWGIISDLTDENGKVLFVTLEHAFPWPAKTTSFSPKVPPGAYTCVLGTHQLDHGGPQQLYEITGVVGHKGILFHKGNFNRDSDGCVLLGTSLSPSTQSINNSTKAFEDFMKLQNGEDFTLTVV